MIIILGQFVLKNSKNVNIEVKRKIKGIGLSLSKKMNILNGGTILLKVRQLKPKQREFLGSLLQKFKGVYAYNYVQQRKIFERLRRKDAAYRYLRYLKGYPTHQRTRTNANTVRRLVKGYKSKTKNIKKTITANKKGKKPIFRLDKKNTKLMAKLKQKQQKKARAKKKKLWKKQTKN